MNTSRQKSRILLYLSCFPRYSPLHSDSCEFRIIASKFQISSSSSYLGGQSAVIPNCSSAQRRFPRLIAKQGVGVAGVAVLGWGSRSSDDGSSHTALREDLDMLHGTFVRPDLTRFTCLDELGLKVVAQRVGPGQASLVCRVVDPDDRCRRGGAGQGHPAAGSCPVRVVADDAVLAGTGPARLLDMAEDRSKAAVKAWLAQRPQGVVRWGGGGRDGRIHRVQDRRQRGSPNRDGSDGTAPCRPPCPGRPGPMPAPRPARTPRAPRPGRRSPVPGPLHPPRRHRSTDRATTRPPGTFTRR